MPMLRNPGLGDAAEAGYAQLAKKQCKPDFEKMIAIAREKATKCHAVLDSVIDLIDTNRIEDKMAELVGEVYIMQHQLSKRIEQLIKEEESWVD